MVHITDYTIPIITPKLTKELRYSKYDLSNLQIISIFIAKKRIYYSLLSNQKTGRDGTVVH